MDIQQNNVAVLHFNLVNQDGSTIFIRKTKLATFNLINPSAVSVPITDIGFDSTLNQCWIRISKESNAATGQYYGVLNIVDDDWGTYTTSKIKVYSVVSDADEDTKSVVFTATCIATQVTNPSGGNSPYYNTTTSTWWQYSDTLKAFEDTGVGNLIKYITKNVQHLKDGTGNGSVVTCLDDEISANNTATGLCSTDLGKNNENRGESCVALGENNYIAEGVSNATAIAGAQPSAVDVFAIGDKTKGHRNVFEINKFGDIYFRPDSSQEKTAILQDILDSVIKNVFYDSSKYSLTVTFYSAADNANKTKTYDLSGLKAVLKDDAVKEISVNQSTAVMTVNTINGSSQQIQLPTVQSNWSTTDTSADSYILNKPTALSSFTNDSGYDTVPSVNSKLASYLPLAGGVTTGDIGVIATASNYTGYSLPAAGTLGGSTQVDDLAVQLKSSRSFIGSVNLSNGVWWNIISVRHRNGRADGASYGMYIKNSFSGGPLTYNTQTASSTWIGERIILDSNNYSTYSLPLAGGTLTGDLIFSDSGTATKGIYGITGSDDGWRLIGGASANHSGWLELATGDDGNEPIYVRQYYGVYNSIAHSATLLDACGNTSFPGTVTASSFSGNEIQSRVNGAVSDLFLNRRGGPVHFGVNDYYITSDGSNYSGNAATSYSSNYIKSNKWNWSGFGPIGTGSTVKKIASITDMSYLEIDGGNSVGTAGDKGVIKIIITYINGIIISNNSTASTNFGYVITSTTGWNDGKVNIDLYLQERDGENYYNILVSKLVGSAISFESPSAAAITAPSGYVAIN